MSGIVRLVALDERAAPGLIKTFQAAGFDVATGPSEASATLLVTLAQPSGMCMATTAAFANTAGEERLAVHIWHVPTASDWEASRHAATMAAYTRYAALDWAWRRVRVNGVTLAAAAGGDNVAEHDVGATILALWRWHSMTGQIIHLGL